MSGCSRACLRLSLWSCVNVIESRLVFTCLSAERMGTGTVQMSLNEQETPTEGSPIIELKYV